MAQTPTCLLDGGPYKPPLGDCAIYSETTVTVGVFWYGPLLRLLFGWCADCQRWGFSKQHSTTICSRHVDSKRPAQKLHQKRLTRWVWNSSPRWLATSRPPSRSRWNASGQRAKRRRRRRWSSRLSGATTTTTGDRAWKRWRGLWTLEWHVFSTEGSENKPPTSSSRRQQRFFNSFKTSIHLYIYIWYIYI